MNLLNGTKKQSNKVYRRAARWKKRIDEIDELKKIFYQFLMEASFDTKNNIQMLNKMKVYHRYEPENAIFTMDDLNPTSASIRKLTAKIEFKKKNQGRD